MDTKKDFWDSQAAKGELSGTKDRYAKELEMAAIARYVKDGMRVLDVGCGDGETLKFIVNKLKGISGIGVDSSSEMVRVANTYFGDFPSDYSFPLFIQRDIRHIKGWNRAPFDLIYTQRALINLDTWEEQRQAILDIMSLLKPGGTYVMVECFFEGLYGINLLREKVGLPRIERPWHNLYLSSYSLQDWLGSHGYSWEQDYFSGAYYFMSRVVNAWYYEAHGLEPAYDTPINLLGTLLPPECVNLRGQTQLWAIKKKEGE